METTELLMHLAEIAGVFVGFGALISIRSEATGDEEVTMIRQIVLVAILVVVAALLPVMISSFGVAGHGLWVTSAGVFLVLWWASSLLNIWDFERTRVLAAVPRLARAKMEIPAAPFWLSMNFALILILTGRFPDQDPALYLTAVAANLFLTAEMLLYLVYLQRRPQRTRQTEPPPELSKPVTRPARSPSSDQATQG